MALTQDPPSPTLTLPAALYTRGFKRFIDGALASGWLVTWVFGEIAVLGLISTTIVSLIDMVVSVPLPASFPRVIDPGVASGFLLFGTVFLTMWTVGGLAVGKHLFRSVLGEDRIW
jgi:hypothetical protein